MITSLIEVLELTNVNRTLMDLQHNLSDVIRFFLVILWIVIMIRGFFAAHPCAASERSILNRVKVSKSIVTVRNI